MRGWGYGLGLGISGLDAMKASKLENQGEKNMGNEMNTRCCRGLKIINIRS